MSGWQCGMTRRLMLAGAALVLIAIPHLAAYGLGFLWLWERGGVWYFWYWGAVAAAASALGWWIVARVRAASPAGEPKADARPPVPFPPVGERAWAEVERLADRAAAANLPLNQPQQLWELVWEVLVAVAVHYRPYNPRRAALEVTVPETLAVVELVAHDLRRAMLDRVPAAHLVTIADLQRMQRLGTWGKWLWRVYRVAAAPFDLWGAVVRELRNYFGGRAIDASVDEIKSQAVRYAVQRAGYYAIRLYSGELAVDVQSLDEYVTRRSHRDLAQAQRRDDSPETAESLVGEPLRILVLGQVKSGKSSLVNALFGEARAATDVLPCTTEIAAYELVRDGMRQAILLDTAGYEDPKSADGARQLEREIVGSDLVILVCSATHAARDADRRLLDRVRRAFDRDFQRRMPPVVVAVTHIDQLRPLGEWQPPYDLDRDGRSKARNIAAACRAVAESLEVPAACVVPVCLKEVAEQPIYNVEEALVPTLLHHLPEAKRSRYLRCLKAHRTEEQWKLLWRQTLGGSGTLLDGARAALGELVEKAWKWL